MSNVTNTKTIAKNKSKMQRGSNIFYAALMAFPVIQFVLFYIVVNFKSFGYAFMQQEKISDTEIVWHFTFDNITQWFSNPSKFRDLLSTTKMSLLYYAVTLAVSIPLGLLFAYYIFKKMPASKLFRIFLFIPSMTLMSRGRAKAGCHAVPQMIAAAIPESGYLHRMVRAIKEPME